jgi:hypothetical protein
MAKHFDGRKLNLLEHVADCNVCSRAQGRANDFCERGRFLFFEWAKDQTPTGAVLLSEEESARVIEQERKRVRKASDN